MQKRLFLRYLGLVCLAAAVYGCRGDDEKPPPPPPTMLKLVFIAAPDLNPDGDNRPSPLVVRLYELKSPTVFENADFFTLFYNDEAALGAELQLKDEFEFAVNEHRRVVREAQPETRYVGVIGAYRNIEQAGWRAVVEVPLQRTTTYAIKLNRLSIAIE